MKIFLNLIDTYRILEAQGKGGSCASLDAMVDCFLSEMNSIESIQYTSMWTQNSAMKRLARKHQYQIFSCELPAQVDSLNRATPQEWDQMTSEVLRSTFQVEGDLRIFIDTQCLMISHRTIEKMCDAVLEDEQAHVAYPVYSVDPHIYMASQGTAGCYPLWDYPGLDRQKYPALYRKVEVFVYHPYRLKFKQPLKELPYSVSWYEGKRYGANIDLLAFAGHMLKRRKGMKE